MLQHKAWFKKKRGFEKKNAVKFRKDIKKVRKYKAVILKLAETNMNGRREKNVGVYYIMYIAENSRAKAKESVVTSITTKTWSLIVTALTYSTCMLSEDITKFGIITSSTPSRMCISRVCWCNVYLFGVAKKFVLIEYLRMKAVDSLFDCRLHSVNKKVSSFPPKRPSIWIWIRDLRVWESKIITSKCYIRDLHASSLAYNFRYILGP